MFQQSEFAILTIFVRAKGAFHPFTKERVETPEDSRISDINEVFTRLY